MSAKKTYLILTTIILFVIVIAPLFFYWSKVTKNPTEFMTQKRTFITIEGKAINSFQSAGGPVFPITGVSPAVMPLIKVGDYQVDCNGEENITILSVLKTEPAILWKASIDGGKTYTDFISEGKDVYLSLNIRYNKVGDMLVLHPTGLYLLVGSRIGATFQDKDKTKTYYLDIEITKITKP